MERPWTTLINVSTACLVAFGAFLTAPAEEPHASDQSRPKIAVKANSPDEPLAKQLSLAKAAEFLDAVNVQWTEERKCGSCHTNYAYMLAGPFLSERGSRDMFLSVRRFFEDRAAHWDSQKPLWDTEVVATASALAFNDAQTTGKLHPVTRAALDRMWQLQRPDGSWDWLKCNWPPAEADDYYGVVVAALGTGVAPDRYAETAAARAGLGKIKAYLNSTRAPSLHHETMLLWASCYIPDLMLSEQKDAIVRRLLELQRADGGWSLPSLGQWKRHSGEPNDVNGSPSDGYATGLVVYVLRQAGLAKEHASIRKGIAWLTCHQRQSGRWFTRSLNNDRHHYITHAGTAYAVMALRVSEAR